MLNGDKALAWAAWFRGLATDKLMPVEVRRRSRQGLPQRQDRHGLDNGSWGAATAARSRQRHRVPAAAGLRQRPEDRRRVLAVGHVHQLRATAAGAMEYLEFASTDKYVAMFATASVAIPSTDAAAATVKGYETGGENDVFRRLSKKFAVLRPATPGYPFIATSSPRRPKTSSTAPIPKRRSTRPSRTSTTTKKPTTTSSSRSRGGAGPPIRLPPGHGSPEFRRAAM